MRKSEVKAANRLARKAARKGRARARQKKRREQWHCFWTWPFGHAWIETPDAYDYRFRCATCPKTKGYVGDI